MFVVPTSQTLRCPACAAENRAGARFCRRCQQPLTGSVDAVTDQVRSEMYGDRPVLRGHQPTAGLSETRLEGPIIGVVRGFQQRQEQTFRGGGGQGGGSMVSSAPMMSTWTIWTFWLERYDAFGRPLARVPVEMRARSFSGSLADGDEVEINRPWKRGQTMTPKQVRNLSTGALVTAGGGVPRLLALPVVLFACLMFAQVGLAFAIDLTGPQLPDWVKDVSLYSMFLRDSYRTQFRFCLTNPVACNSPAWPRKLPAIRNECFARVGHTTCGRLEAEVRLELGKG